MKKLNLKQNRSRNLRYNKWLIGTYVFIILVRVEKSCWRSLTHVWNCMYAHAQVWTLLRVANQQSGRNQVVATTTTTKSYDQRLCYRAENFIILVFSSC